MRLRFHRDFAPMMIPFLLFCGDILIFCVDMKCHYFLLVTALALFVDVAAFGWDGKAGDEETKKERTVCRRKNETSLQEPRYEMIDDFLLDKYTGNVFYVYVLFSKAEKIMLNRESAGSDVVHDHEHVNYQLIVKRDVTDSYYLLNLVSGDMWYIRNVSSKKARLQYLSPVLGEVE